MFNCQRKYTKREKLIMQEREWSKAGSPSLRKEQPQGTAEVLASERPSREMGGQAARVREWVHWWIW